MAAVRSVIGPQHDQFLLPGATPKAAGRGVNVPCVDWGRFVLRQENSSGAVHFEAGVATEAMPAIIPRTATQSVSCKRLAFQVIRRRGNSLVAWHRRWLAVVGSIHSLVGHINNNAAIMHQPSVALVAANLSPRGQRRVAVIVFIIAGIFACTWTVRAAVPTVTTQPAAGQSNTVATLNGLVNPEGDATGAWFEWGAVRSSLTNTTAPASLGSGSSAVATSAALAELVPGTIYFGQLVASNSAGTKRGSVIRFGSPSLTLAGSGTMQQGYGVSFVDPGVTASGHLMGIAAGGFHSVAVLSDGSVAAWGYNTSGQADVPAGLSNVVEVVAGQALSAALSSDGVLLSWGAAGTQVSGVERVSAGGFHGVYVQTNGQGGGWGSDSFLQVDFMFTWNDLVSAGAAMITLSSRGRTERHRLTARIQMAS